MARCVVERPGTRGMGGCQGRSLARLRRTRKKITSRPLPPVCSHHALASRPVLTYLRLLGATVPVDQV